MLVLKKISATLLVAIGASVVAGIASTSASAASITLNADDGKSSSFTAGAHLSDNVKAGETGLPIYPGAKRERKKSDDSDSVNLSFWGGDFGFKLVVLSFESVDTPEKVSAFYQDAMARYGTVLTCAERAKKTTRKVKTTDARRAADTPVNCDDDSINNDGKMLRVGTRAMQRAVAMQPRGSGSTFQLFLMEKRGTD